MPEQFLRSGTTGIDGVSYDAGLRAHMLRVFNYMGGGLALTGILAFVVANTALANVIFGSPVRILVMLAPIGVILYMNARMQTMSTGGLKTLYWVFCGLMGLSMGSIFLVYSQASIARAFFITGATFGAMSLYGYSTKRDLAGMGSFMMMGLFGLLIASVVNMFMMSSMLQWVTSVMGVLIFTGLTAWNVQSVKQSYSAGWGDEANEKSAVLGALSLYMSFINLFNFILSLTGGSRN